MKNQRQRSTWSKGILIGLALHIGILSANEFPFEGRKLVPANGNPIKETYNYNRAKMSVGVGYYNDDSLPDLITGEGYKNTYKIWINSGTRENYLYTTPKIVGKDEVLKDPAKNDGPA